MELRRDPAIRAADAQRLVELYCAGTDVSHPRLTLDVAGGRRLPPTLVQAGGGEMLVGDARKLAADKWDDGRYPGERSDGEHVLLYGKEASLDVLTQQTPEDGETYVDEQDRFGVLTRRLWQPLLDHETRVIV